MKSALLLIRRHPRLGVLLLAQGVSVLGDGAYLVVLAGVPLTSHRTVLFSVSVGAEVLGGTLALPFAGVLVDRHNRRQILGRVLSLDALANSALQPLGIVLAPALPSVTSIPAVALTLLACLLATTVAPAAAPGVLAFSDPLPAVNS